MAMMRKINLRTGEVADLSAISLENEHLYPKEIEAPLLYTFLPDKRHESGRSVLMVPGGGYTLLALAQCFDMALWLNFLGLPCSILAYRLPHGSPHRPLEDMERAWAYLRAREKEWRLPSHGLGIMGFSAGGQLAANWATLKASDPLLRPAFTVLYYPVINLQDPVLFGLTQRFLGQEPALADMKRYSAHDQVTPHTSPALIILSDDDPVVPPVHGTLYYNALKAHGVSASLHIFTSGGHAWSLGGGEYSGQLFIHAAQAMPITARWLLGKE